MKSPEHRIHASEPSVEDDADSALYPRQNPEAVITHLALADDLKRRIDAGKASLHPESDLWSKILEKMRVDWTYHSNAIEGSTLSRGDTLFFLQEGLTVEGKPFKDFLDARNHAEAIDLLFDVVANARPISERLLKEVNALLLNGVLQTPARTPAGQAVSKTVHAGQYKRLPNHVLQQDGTPASVCCSRTGSPPNANPGYLDQRRPASSPHCESGGSALPPGAYPSL
jgi:hypothetical protein